MAQALTLRAMFRTKMTATWGELLCSTSPALRSALWLGLGLGIAQQASGSEAAVYYSPAVLDDAGWAQTAVLNVANVCSH